jgi:hypothetical protein
MMTLPRVGQEVLVDFLTGDPEQPVVVGRVFNTTNPVIERLPERATRSAWKSDTSPVPGGFNEILLEDRKGEELLYEQAERDARRLVKQDETETVVRDRRKAVAGNETETTQRHRIQVTDRDRLEMTGGNRTTAVERTRRDRVERDAIERIEAAELVFVERDAHGITRGIDREKTEQHLHLQVGGSRQEAVGGGDSLTVGERYQESVGSDPVMAVGPNEGTIHLVAGSAIVLEAAAEAAVLGAGGFIDIAGGVVTIEGAEVVINEGGGPGSLPGPGAKLPEPPREAVVEPPSPPQIAPPAEKDSFYELLVLDEFEAPISGLDVVVTTPDGTTTETTDASGRVRVAPAPPQLASAYVKNPGDVARLLVGREKGPRRTTLLPDGKPWHVRTPVDLAQTILLPEKEPQKLMIVTRLDLAHHAARSPYDRHAPAGSAALTVKGDDPVVLGMQSDGGNAEAIVMARVTRPGDATGTEPARGLPQQQAESTGASTEWLRANVDSLHDAVFRGAFDAAFQVLATIPLDPPADVPTPVETSSEQASFDMALAALEAQGIHDAPVDADAEQEQV